MRVLATLITLVALTACGGGNESNPVGPAPALSTGTFEGDLNAFRATAGRVGVRAQAQLQQAAQSHAQDMVNRGYFSHTSKDGPNGEILRDRVSATGYNGCAIAENIAHGQTTPAQVFESWETSAGHRRNMLGERYTQYGLGRTVNTWVLVMAAPC